MCYATSNQGPPRQSASAGGAYAQRFFELLNDYQPGTGARVPADSMRDTPFYVQDPINVGRETDTAVEPTYPNRAPPAAVQAYDAQSPVLFKQLDDVTARIRRSVRGSPDHLSALDEMKRVNDQLNALQVAATDPSIGRVEERLKSRFVYPEEDANVIQRAIQDRQNQPRQPLPRSRF